MNNNQQEYNSAFVNYQLGLQKRENNEFASAIFHYEQAIDYNPPLIYTSLSESHYQFAQELLQRNGKIMDNSVYNEYSIAYDYIKRALEYETTDNDEKMLRNLLAGITSGGLLMRNPTKENYLMTKKYLRKAADLGSIEAIGLLRAMP